MWLQGYILGVTGTELSQDQISRIGENLEKIQPTQSSGIPPERWGGTGPNGELYRC
jgi:hypothetical protein